MPVTLMAQALRLVLITDDTGKTPQQLSAVVSAAIRGGVTAVQFREKHAPEHRCRAALEELYPICEAGGVPLLLNADLLDRAGQQTCFHGIQLNWQCVPEAVSEAYLAGPEDPLFALSEFLEQQYPWANCRNLILGYSAHSIPEAARVIHCGANFVTLSPIYETPSKQGILPACGADFLRAARGALPRAQIVALGGISAGNTAEVIAAGADGVAVIRAIMAAGNPDEAARQLRETIEIALDARQPQPASQFSAA